MIDNAMRLATGTADATSSLSWPAPHHFRLIDAGPAGEPERALLTFAHGDKLLGTVLAIDFEQQQLQFRPEQGPLRQLGFADFRSLFLSRSVELEPVPLQAPPGAVLTRSKRAKRACTVQLKDGAELKVDVAAVLPRRAGLFLYVVNYADAVLRWFVPAQALVHYHVGGQAGPTPLESAQLHAGPAANVAEFFARGNESREQVEQAMQRRKLASRDLGDVLVQEGLISPQQRDAAIARQEAEGRPLHELLGEMGAVSREVIRQAMVSQLGVPAVQLARFPFEANALRAITPELARKHRAMPLFSSAKRIAVALENPLSWEALRELEFFTGLKVDPCLAAPAELDAAIEEYYGDARAAGEKVGELLRELGADDETAAAAASREPVTESDNTLVRLVNKMIVDAYDQGASDIHIETRGDDRPSRVRFRQDGVLAPYIEVPPNFRAAFIARIKIMAELDIAERRRPQDGRIVFHHFGPRQIELRVLTIPTARGAEDVVMRILAAPRVMSLDKLALPPRELARLKEGASRSYGLLLVCGPTGSGKTTTLHALLAHINTPERKIWTVEDPVEITQEGLCQVQVNAKLGLTFPAVLRSFLRADPDVIMVGETRDAETARTVTAAALTGHLVLSTMHTNSAVESVVRLVDLEVDPFNFSDALVAVVGQRLVRRLCQCKRPYAANREEIQALAHESCRETGQDPSELAARWRTRYGDADGAITLHAAQGCPDCDHSGYKGRLGVYELLVNSPAIKKAIQRRAGAGELLQLAVQEGMATLEQDAIAKILQGHLDFKQVLASCR
ncbi:ATPase, T2SS/T4P/T4SS family [Ramlibacter tataouinensis]|uniref:GspE/PulE family protein n=1 Tax=Ramlibacter tataouinensis TaxID=94132 RepID=UPI0022F3EE03|nr:ATPase, T2SS/T4P/T4SS family [Ramlibacter tataouinensis]WBY03141.1 ATPase, T2SS/T4P/T4SS family [Ramlibacter tataouinensis]